MQRPEEGGLLPSSRNRKEAEVAAAESNEETGAQGANEGLETEASRSYRAYRQLQRQWLIFLLKEEVTAMGCTERLRNLNLF